MKISATLVVFFPIVVFIEFKFLQLLESLSDNTSNESDALLGHFIRRLIMVVV